MFGKHRESENKRHYGKSYYYYYYIISAIVLQAPLGVASAVIIKQSSFSVPSIKLHSVSKASTAQSPSEASLSSIFVVLTPQVHSPAVSRTPARPAEASSNNPLGGRLSCELQSWIFILPQR